jgi:signal transduction histidine kinase
MNSFDELLKKMMGIIMTNSGAESGAIIVKEGYFGIAAYSVRSTEPTCQTFEAPIPLRDDDDKISTSIVHYVIHTHTNLFIRNVANDTRFATGDGVMKKGAVICMPIMHKGTLVGVLYLQASLNTFTNKHANVLALLCDQIGISITNALLFKSVQKATKANALMIESQLKALEEARASREQALRATKMKSNFLANMSHELRTPFSGFYGMISLLSETRLDAEQREFVSIAKQSCEMLLHIIDDLLDFSKLEAHKVKLHYGLFYIEDLIADRMELLITLTTNKNVEMSYFIDPDVPSIVYGDGNRIGQILMNLIGNAIKFTYHGEVVVRCGVDKSKNASTDPDHVTLKISVQDTGIGMAENEQKGLFLPFSQVDGSTTR